jgi:serine/threonine protein kinase
VELINQKIGKYILTRVIGEGGMACVYEGLHEKLGTRVAVKVLSPLLARNAQLRQRFENEANFMASLNHPNITRVLDLEEQDGTIAIVMELLEGEDLDVRVKRLGPLPDDEIKYIFSQVLNAFEYAHSKGIVHRDIKPANIFVDASNQVKILDFGIAKVFGTGNEMTQTGTQMGTPVYMSPEQVKGDKSIDHRSDIYSLGVTMYFLLSAQVPFSSESESSFEIFTKIVNDPIPTLNNDFFNEIIQKATCKDRNERYQELIEMNIFKNFNSFIPKSSNVKSEKEIVKLETINLEKINNLDFDKLEVYEKDSGFMDWHQAVSECEIMNDSWRLPTLNELNFLYENQHLFNGFQSQDYYWSDNTDSEINVWVKYFYTGYQCRINKRQKARVRFVRTSQF